MDSKQFIIEHPSQLNALSVFPLFRKAGIGRITFSPSFEYPQKERWENDLNREYYACGCSQGAKALILGLLVFGAAGAVGYWQGTMPLLNSFYLFLGGSVAMAGLGKLTGLVYASKRLKQTTREIQSVWIVPGKETKVIHCG